MRGANQQALSAPPNARSVTVPSTSIPVGPTRPPNRFPALSGLTWTALVLAALLAVPALYVVSKVFVASDGTWRHLAATVLPEYVRNTVWLGIGVGIGVMVVGVATAWLVTMCSFPGSRMLEWALILPLAVPAYVMAYTYTDFLQSSGPVQTGLRELTGWSVREYWFPDIRSLGGAITVMVFVLYPYVYLVARTAFLEQSQPVIRSYCMAPYGCPSRYWVLSSSCVKG